MKGGGLTTSGRPHYKNDTIGLCDHVEQEVVVSFTHSHGIERHRLARGENTHDHVLFASHRGDSGHPQFNIKGRVFPEFYLAVLRLSPLSNVQVGHNLYPGDHGPLVVVWDGLVDMAGSVYSESDLRARLTWIGFDMYI